MAGQTSPAHTTGLESKKISSDGEGVFLDIPFYRTSIDLVDRITLPDGSYYQFSYEPTPGGASGAVTGRLASITLPTGGTISYQYSGGCNGNGLNADGTTGSLSRTADGTRYYGRSPSSNGSTTTLQDEAGNQALYTFTDVGGVHYETHRQVYQGAASGTPLLDQQTCYSGATPNCDGASITLPITATSAVVSQNGTVLNRPQNYYDASTGLQTSALIYDASSNLQQTTSYNYTGAGLLSSVQVKDGALNLMSQATYGYDEQPSVATSGIPQHNAASGQRGNQTSSHTWINTSGSIDTSTAYYDTGVPISSTGPTGTTQYAYESTQGLATQVTPPTPSSGVSLPSYASYDPNSGIQLSASDANFPNSSQVQYTYYDKLLRPTQINTADGGQTTYSYSDANTFWMNQNVGNGATTHYVTHRDGYGRLDRTAVYNGQSGSNTWYQVDYCYDATGLLHFQSAAYQGTGFSGANANKQCSGSGTTYTYDALGRVTNINTADGNTTYQYSSRAVLMTDVNGVRKITQTDELGRVTAICEISGSSVQGDSPQDCQLDIAGTGYKTTYTYDLANHKTTIQQGQQTRVFQTDSLGRTTMTQEPESGTTNYSYAYNSTGLDVTRKRPRANQTDPNTLTTTTTQYDAVGRVLTISYDDGTPTKNFSYDASVGWAILNQSNVKGKLSGAWVYTPNLWAASVFSYDSMGRVTGLAECLPSGCGNPAKDKLLSFTYDLAGNMTSASDGAGVTTAYSYTPAGEVQSISSSLSDAAHPGILVSNVQNGPNGPLSYQSGNGVISSFSYDTSGRRNGGWVCNNSTQNGCIGGTQLYGYVANQRGPRITSSSDTALNQQSTYGYDDFNRLTSLTVTQGTVQNYTYAYDRYGNRWQQNGLQGGPSPQLSSAPSSNHILGYSYDAAGNVTSDGINSYSYDAEGNLIQETSGSTTSFSYNALNQQVRATASWGSTENVFNASGQIASLWFNGNVIFGKAYWGSTPIESYSPSMAYFQHRDWVGSLRLETNGTGAVTAVRTNLPFGDGATNASGGRDNTYDGFTGLWDGVTSATNHAQFREYSNISGRWLSPDPYMGSYDGSDPQSFNRYSYVLNNPLSLADPSGLDPTCTPDDDPEGCIGMMDLSADGIDPLHPPDPGNPNNHGEPGPNKNDCGVFCPGDYFNMPTSNPWDFMTGTRFGVGGSRAPSNETPANPCSYIGRALPPSAYAAAGNAAKNNPVTSALDFWKGFKIGGYLDAQPLASGNVYARAAYGNYVFGVYMAAAGFPLSVTLAGADGIAAIHKFSNPNQYNGRQMDNFWASLPTANVANITAGYNAQRSGITCHN